MDSRDSPFRSPDGKHLVSLTFVDQLFKGAADLYSLVLDDVTYGARRFAGEIIWSPDSKYLFVQELFTDDFSRGLISHLLIIDTASKREFVASRATNGEFQLLECKNGMVYYKKLYPGAATKIIEYERDLPEESDWTPYKDS